MVVISCRYCCVCVSVYPFLPFFNMAILHFLLFFFFFLSLPCDFSPQEDILILSVCFSRLLLFSWILTYQFLSSIFCPHSLSLPLLSSHRLNRVSWCHLSCIERRPRGPETPLSLWKPQRELDSALRMYYGRRNCGQRDSGRQPTAPTSQGGRMALMLVNSIVILLLVREIKAKFGVKETRSIQK